MNEAPLSLYEASELFYLALDTQDRFFEFWITATFAVIIACHIGSTILSRSFSIMISFIYLAFSANMIGKWFIAGEAMTRYRDMIATHTGIQPQGTLADLSTMLSMTTLFIGTGITIFFVWYTYKNQKVVDRNG